MPSTDATQLAVAKIQLWIRNYVDTRDKMDPLTRERMDKRYQRFFPILEDHSLINDDFLEELTDLIGEKSINV